MAIQKPENFFLKFHTHVEDLISTLNNQISSCGFPLYSSLDIRDAGFKVAVVDVNLFPAGFNILSTLDKERASRKMTEFLSAKLMIPPPWRITLVPEAHTSNQGYLDNVAALINILKVAGCEIKLLWSGPPIPKMWSVKTRCGFTLEYLPANEALSNSQALILNHDLSGGIPEAIKNVTLPTYPSKQLGWFRRKKSSHQEIVESVLQKLSNKFDWFDSWYFSTLTIAMDHVDFSKDTELTKVAGVVDESIAKISEEYKKRNIAHTPRVFVKNDAGTYGMGVIGVATGQEIIEANRNLRKKMRLGKESVPISRVIVQEAVPTALQYFDTNTQKHIAGEPVLYMVNGIPIGGFVRIHEELGPQAQHLSLNQPGSLLEPIECPDNLGKMTRPFPTVRESQICGQLGSRQIYGFLARLHAIAAGLEDCLK
jgi:glutamate--cysteine ligase